MSEMIGCPLKIWWLILTNEGYPLVFKNKILIFSTKKLANDFIKNNSNIFSFHGLNVRYMSWRDIVSMYQHLCKEVSLDWLGPSKGSVTGKAVFYQIKLF